jgi:hypothetical protein
MRKIIKKIFKMDFKIVFTNVCLQVDHNK